MNDEGRRHSAPATSYINVTAANRTSVGGRHGGREWPRCPSCNAGFPAPEHVDRHLVRACPGEMAKPLIRRLPRSAPRLWRNEP